MKLESPPFTGLLDAARFEPRAYGLSVVATDFLGRCAHTEVPLYLDRVTDEGVTSVRTSADGQVIAYTVFDGQRSNLRAATVAGGRPRLVGMDVAADDYRMADRGSRIAFISAKEGRRALYLDVAPTPLFIAEGVQRFVLSPDGSTVAYVRMDGHDIVLRRLGTGAGVPVGSGAAVGVDDIAFVDDGRALAALTRDRDGPSTLSVYDVKSGIERYRLARTRRFFVNEASRHLLVERGVRGGPRSMQSYPVEPGGSERGAILASGAEVSSVGLSSDARTFCFVVDGVFNAYRHTSLAGEPQPLLGSGAVKDVGAARLSPDGGRALTVSNQYDIGKAALVHWIFGQTGDATAETLLVGDLHDFDLDQARFPSSGATLAYRHRGELWVWDSAGRARLLGAGVEADVAFSPAVGGRLAFRQGAIGTGPVLKVYDVDEGEIEAVPAALPVRSFSWSPTEVRLVTMEAPPDAANCGGPCRHIATSWFRHEGAFRGRLVSIRARSVGFSGDGAAVIAVGTSGTGETESGDTVVVTAPR